MTTAARRLTDEAFDMDEALRDWIDGDEETLQGDGSEQRKSARGDETWGGDFALVDGEAHLGDRPGLLPSTGGLNGLVVLRDQLEIVRDGAWQDKKRRAGVDERIDRRCSAARSSHADRDVEESHAADCTRPMTSRKCRILDTGARLVLAGGSSTS